MAVPYEELLFPPPNESLNGELYKYIKNTFSEPFFDGSPVRIGVLEHFLKLKKGDAIKLQLAEALNGTVVQLKENHGTDGYK